MSDEPLAFETENVKATLVPNRGTNGGFSLVIDGTTQSHVNPKDPLDLQLEYVRLVAGIVDGVFPMSEPLRVLVLGGGALTLPRYFGATRPGSRQHVVELHRPLLEFVLETLPLDPVVDLDVEFGDARAAVEGAAAAGGDVYDVAIVDVFSGAMAPPALSTLEFFQLLRGLLVPGGVLVVNTLATKSLDFSRSVLATLEAIGENVLALAAPQVVLGESAGNIVVATSDRPFDPSAVLAAVPVGPREVGVIHDASLAAFVGDAAVRRDRVSGM